MLLGGVASSYLAYLLVGVRPFLGLWGWYLVASLIGAWPVVLLLRALGYRTPYLAAVAALLTGALISTFVARWLRHGVPMLFMPGLRGITGLPSLLVSAWVVEMFAAKPRSRRRPARSRARKVGHGVPVSSVVLRDRAIPSCR